ncbi:peroxiredoxin [Inhella gelatinilytica]|uniref:Glutathione-dependent peroxiredoxin n=1 Tax=Inhella gelatinilytica TaxID=2795030 RepID=A0A931IWA2_9BURK|nr:peroxiredoxin [Inhella gelatinilytica]MBH9554020.1 peroxiredoxin [Inhella gelatinilytica]
MIALGHALPSVTVYEFLEEAAEGCTVGPNPVSVAEAARGKTILLFALPGAYTPTCSAQHLPGYVALAATIKEKGIDEIWCVSVNDAFVMHAWGKSMGATGVVRMLADGSAELTKALGLTLDLTAKGMGVRSQRFAMLLKDGQIADLQVEAPGKFEVSRADAMLARI